MARPMMRGGGTMYRLSSSEKRRKNHSARTGSVSAAPRNWSNSAPEGRHHQGIGSVRAWWKLVSPMRVHDPHRIGGLGGGPVDLGDHVVGAGLQCPPQMAGLQRRHRHALPEGGVEAGHGVAEREDPGREAVQLVVAAPSADRERVECRFADGLGLCQCVGEMRRQQLVGERQHVARTSSVVWRRRPRRWSAPRCRPRSTACPAPVTGHATRRRRPPAPGSGPPGCGSSGWRS